MKPKLIKSETEYSFKMDGEDYTISITKESDGIEKIAVFDSNQQYLYDISDYAIEDIEKNIKLFCILKELLANKN